MKKTYDVLSPDGFPINPEMDYPNIKTAIKETKKFAKRYIGQGYYSSNKGRIPIDYIPSECTLVEKDVNGKQVSIPLCDYLPGRFNQPYF